jgi:GNAT superfamily N-acetyltransferase
MRIEPAGPLDLERLERWTPSGATQIHARRFERQAQGLGTYLIAWGEQDPVASVEIRWDGCAAEEVRQRFPRCPELNGLQVWPASQRGKGIGSGLIGYAEDLARERGFHELGLGVNDDNPGAEVLYLRLGYAETGCRYIDRYWYITPSGARHEVTDPARFLVKQL